MIRVRLTTALFLIGAAFVASAAEDAPAPPAADPVPEVALDDLLALPSGYEAVVERHAGASEAEWRARFAQARQKLEDAKGLLAKAEAELDRVSETSSSWQVAAPGSSDPQTSPLSLRLRSEVRAHRRAIDIAQRELRDLDVQADLASVPQEWRQ